MLCSPSLEEQGAIRSYNRSAHGLPGGLLVRLNLDTSSPDTYRPPPAPIPFNVLFGRPQSPLGTLGTRTAISGVCEQSPGSNKTLNERAEGLCTLASQDDTDKSGRKTLADILLASPTKSDAGNRKSNELNELASEEDDSCPICFEVYDAENPKMVTQCEHEFHLSCILEWMERSDSCPVCDKLKLIANQAK
ncbi:hypothetical protein V2J09_013974 [Rumex salicifolius]